MSLEEDDKEEDENFSLLFEIEKNALFRLNFASPINRRVD